MHHFAEGHGKGPCDAHCGRMSRCCRLVYTSHPFLCPHRAVRSIRPQPVVRGARWLEVVARKLALSDLTGYCKALQTQFVMAGSIEGGGKCTFILWSPPQNITMSTQ